MFKKFFNRSPKNETATSRDPNFKPNVTTITKSGNFAHHSSSHSPFRNENISNSISITPSNKNNAKKEIKSLNEGRPMTQYSQHISNNNLNGDNLNVKMSLNIKKQTQNLDPSELRESFLNGMGSISEATNEGKKLVQVLPSTKDVSASKIPTISNPVPNSIFTIKNKDTGELFDLREKFQIDKILGGNKNEIADMKNFLEEKKKINRDFIYFVKSDNFTAIMEIFDKKKIPSSKKPDINFKGENDWTSLHYACYNGNLKIVNFLLYHEAIIDSENIVSQTPLMIASQRGYDDIVHVLCNAGAEINHIDFYLNTPLHYAASNGHISLIEFYIMKPSIQPFLKNRDNKTPYDICKPEIRPYFDKFMTKKKNMNDPRKTHNVIVNTNFIDFKKTDSSLFSACTAPDDRDVEKIGPNSFLVLGLIGKGSFGEVYLVEKKNTKSLHAMKVLHKNKVMKNNLVKYAMTERNVLSLTNHPFIVRLNSAFQTPDKLFLILDYCPGGDLSEHLQKEKKFDEERVKIYLAEITLALEDLHKRDIIFRDLKPDNIVLDVNGHAKLTDFGLSKEGVLDHNQGARSFCGSVAYLAPEMLKRCGHGKAVDWYLLGVVMYELLVGIPPYYANNREELFQNIEKAPLKLPSYISNEARSLLKALLQRNPAKRLGSGKGDAEEIKAHPFFNSLSWNDVFEMKLKPPKPNRKLRICTKFDQDVFAVSSFVEAEKEYVQGWSFATTEKKK